MITEIEQITNRFKKQRKTITSAVGCMLLTGFGLSFQMFSNESKINSILYCYRETSCKGVNIKHGVDWIIQGERRNQVFDSNIQIIREISAENPNGVLYGLISSCFLLSAYGLSKWLTNNQIRYLHTELINLKIKALENDIILNNHLDLTRFTKDEETRVTKQAIARQSQDQIDSMLSDSEIMMHQINGQINAKYDMKINDLKHSDIDKQIAENELATAELKKKLEKIMKNVKDDIQDKKSASNVEIELELPPNYLWYNRILNEPCKVVTGVSGSGKSTLEGALIQLARQDNQQIIVLYPNTTRTARDEKSLVLSEPNEINSFLENFNDLVVGRKKHCKSLKLDEDDYLDYLADKTGMDGKIAVFAMEINNWEASGIDPFLVAAFYRLCFTDIRKWGITLTMAGQSINQGSVASKLESFSKLLSQQTKVECQATTCMETGKSISKGVALVTYSDQKDPVELPLLFYKPKDKSKY